MRSSKFILLLVVILYGNIDTFCQNTECDLIEKSINTDYFKHEFLICKNDSIVMLFDKRKILNECKEFKVCSQKVVVSRDTINNLMPNNYSSYKPKNLIILYDYSILKNKYTVSFWRPYSGANIVIIYKIKRGKAKIIKHYIGTF